MANDVIRGSISSYFIICMLFVGFLGFLSFEESTEGSRSKTTTLIVDIYGKEDFTKIQDAINVSYPRDIIFVKPGIYYEQLIIDKPLRALGHHKR